jgi:hypothetical protein
LDILKAFSIAFRFKRCNDLNVVQEILKVRFFAIPLSSQFSGKNARKGVQTSALALRGIYLYNGKEVLLHPAARKGIGCQKPTKNLEE